MQVESIEGDVVVHRLENSVNLLIRIMPFILGQDNDDFWWEGESPVGKGLIDGLMRLLFAENFCLEPRLAKDGWNLPSGFEGIWKGGLGHDKEIADPAKIFVERRLAVLQLMIVTLSSNCYRGITEQRSYINLWKWYATSPEIPNARTLFYSLLNTILVYDPDGYLNLPYTSYINSDLQDQLTQLCLQVLIILTDYTPPTEEAMQAYGESCKYAIIEQRADAPFVNEYIHRMGDITMKAEILSIYDAILRVLSNFTDSNTSFLPGSLKQATCYHESIVFLWKFIEFNPSAIPTILAKSTFADAVGPILFAFMESIGEVTNYAMVNVCIFILLKLSSHREFAISLNKQSKSIDYLGFMPGTLADLMISAFARAFKIGATMERLYSYMLITLSNVSPFVRPINSQSAQELVNMLELVSNEEWFLADPIRHHNIFYMVEVLNNFVQYQWEGSHSLALELAKRAHLVHGIESFRVRNMRESAADEAEAPQTESEDVHEKKEIAQEDTMENSEDTEEHQEEEIKEAEGEIKEEEAEE